MKWAFKVDPDITLWLMRDVGGVHYDEELKVPDADQA